MTGEKQKACSKCGATKPLDAFSVNKKSPTGRGNVCKSCTAERSRAWRLANPEKAREALKRYREANPNPDKGTAGRSKAWREANKEKEAARKKAWRQANPEKVAKYSKAWRQANPEKEAEYQRKSFAKRQQKKKASAVMAALDGPDVPPLSF